MIEATETDRGVVEETPLPVKPHDEPAPDATTNPELRAAEISLVWIGGSFNGDGRELQANRTEDKNLVKSVKALGILEPVILYDNGSQHPHAYEVVAGHRRLRAAKEAGLETVPAMVYPTGTPQQVLHAARLAENNHRVAIDWHEEAVAFKSMVEVDGMSVQEIAACNGVTPRYVKQRVKLAELPDAFVKLARKEDFPMAVIGMAADVGPIAVDLLTRAPHVAEDKDWFHQALAKQSPDANLALFDLKAAGLQTTGDLFSSTRFVECDYPTFLVHQCKAAEELAAKLAEAEGWQFHRIAQVSWSGQVHHLHQTDLFTQDIENIDDQNLPPARQKLPARGSAAVSEAVLRHVPKEIRATHGVVVTINGEGEAEVVRGAVPATKNGAMTHSTELGSATTSETVTEKKDEPKPRYALAKEINQYRAIAIMTLMIERRGANAEIREVIRYLGTRLVLTSNALVEALHHPASRPLRFAILKRLFPNLPANAVRDTADDAGVTFAQIKDFNWKKDIEGHSRADLYALASMLHLLTNYPDNNTLEGRHSWNDTPWSKILQKRHAPEVSLGKTSVNYVGLVSRYTTAELQKELKVLGKECISKKKAALVEFLNSEMLAAKWAGSVLDGKPAVAAGNPSLYDADIYDD